jgi:hypothetical protein
MPYHHPPHAYFSLSFLFLHFLDAAFPGAPRKTDTKAAASSPRLGPHPISTSIMAVSDAAIGYLAMLVAALGFGSNFVPVKK